MCDLSAINPIHNGGSNAIFQHSFHKQDINVRCFSVEKRCEESLGICFGRARNVPEKGGRSVICDRLVTQDAYLLAGTVPLLERCCPCVWRNGDDSAIRRVVTLLHTR